MKAMEIKMNVINAIIQVMESALTGNIGNYYSAYITGNGKIYFGEEVDAYTVPETVYNGKDRTICSVQSSVLWDNDDDRYDTYTSYLDEEQHSKLANYIEREKENHYSESLCGIAYIEENFPDIVKEADDALRNDILNDLRYRIENGNSEYEDTIAEIIEWVETYADNLAKI